MNKLYNNLFNILHINRNIYIYILAFLIIGYNFLIIIPFLCRNISFIKEIIRTEPTRAFRCHTARSVPETFMHLCRMRVSS